MEPFIWQNDDLTVTLVDIPDSIAAAQGTRACPATARLLSTKPRTHPWPVPIAKSEEARAKLPLNEPTTKALHHSYETAVVAALDQIKNAMQGKVWCHDRIVPKVPLAHSSPADHSRKRKRKAAEYENDQEVREFEFENVSDTTDGGQIMKIPADLLRSLAKRDPFVQEKRNMPPKDADDTTAGVLEEFARALHNPSHEPMLLTVKPIDKQTNDASTGVAHDFRIPPLSTFILGTCWASGMLRRTIGDMHYEWNLPKKFDVILLDPPYPNASAQLKEGYDIAPSYGQLGVMISKMDLDMHIKPGGFVCMWITNSAKAREFVLGSHGVFAMLNVQLTEEWIWIKTLTTGEPIFPVGSEWRKPYEVLLVGQKAAGGMQVPPTGNWAVGTRVLAGVPDVHSRKPCVKKLLEQLMQVEDGEYTALEIFGRYCVAGWWTWGYEAIKYNWERYWVEKDAEKGKK